MSTKQMLELDKICVDRGTQLRVCLNSQTIKEYAQQMREGADFPEVTVYFDEAEYFLSRGFHRVQARKDAGFTDIKARIISGTLEDAIINAASDNAGHNSERRTNADKKKAVYALQELNKARVARGKAAWANRAMCRMAGVNESYLVHLDEVVDSTRTTQTSIVSEETTDPTFTAAEQIVANWVPDNFSGQSLGWIAKDRKVSRSTAGRALMKLGLYKKGPTPGAGPFPKRQAVINWFEAKNYNGQSQQEIADKHDVHISIVRSVMKDLGIFPPGGRRRVRGSANSSPIPQAPTAVAEESADDGSALEVPRSEEPPAPVVPWPDNIWACKTDRYSNIVHAYHQKPRYPIKIGKDIHPAAEAICRFYDWGEVVFLVRHMAKSLDLENSLRPILRDITTEIEKREKKNVRANSGVETNTSSASGSTPALAVPASR